MDKSKLIRWAIRRLPGPLVLTAVVFGTVYSSAGVDTTRLDGAQPIDYWEECIGEGCAREEVKELWGTFHEECFQERCWMEEVAEDAGTSIFKSSMGDWQYREPHRVAQMIDYFVDRLGHPEARQVMIKPGPTDTFWTRLVKQILKIGAKVSVTCRWEDNGRVHNCAGDLDIG